MRRVYYAFALRTATSPFVFSLALLLAGLYGLTVMVHVASIVNNFKTIQVANLDNYVLNSFLHAEFWTLAFIGLIFFSLLSFRFGFKNNNQFQSNAQVA